MSVIQNNIVWTFLTAVLLIKFKTNIQTISPQVLLRNTLTWTTVDSRTGSEELSNLRDTYLQDYRLQRGLAEHTHRPQGRPDKTAWCLLTVSAILQGRQKVFAPFSGFYLCRFLLYMSGDWGGKMTEFIHYLQKDLIQYNVQLHYILSDLLLNILV